MDTSGLERSESRTREARQHDPVALWGFLREVSCWGSGETECGLLALPQCRYEAGLVDCAPRPWPMEEALGWGLQLLGPEV